MQILPKVSAAVAILILILSSQLSSAQAAGPGTLSGQVIQPAPPAGTGGPAAFATVRVCPTSALGTPCSPLANLFSDSALTQPVPNPFTTDQYGNYSVYLTAGYYLVQITAVPNVIYTYQAAGVSDGTVQSVALALPASVFSISGSPVTGIGTLTGSFISQSANTVFGNCTAGSAIPSFCTLTGTMLPPIPPSLVPWATPGTIGSTTPNTGLFTTLGANVSFTTPLANITTLNVSSGGSLAGTFTGSPTFSGTPTFSAGLIATTLTSASANPATSGIIRLARGDPINWRNASNSGDEGMSTDAADALSISHTNGITLTGTSPSVHLGGETAGFPMLARSGTLIQARLADNSADAPFSAAQGTFSNHIVVDGVTANFSSPSAGQVLVATSGVAAAWGGVPATILAQSTTTTLTTTGIGNSNNTVITKAVTMPSSGCPCRVVAHWWLYLSSTAAGQDVAYVSDGTAGFAGSETATPGSASGFGFTGAGGSTITYANNAVITFNLIMASSHAGGTTVSTSQLGTSITGAPASALNLLVYGSN